MSTFIYSQSLTLRKSTFIYHKLTLRMSTFILQSKFNPKNVNLHIAVQF